jgi:DHA1 family bicyclomycin/chloramphenicol resistance-like MFS transporter
MLFIAASIGCALAPSIAVLDVLRLVQGFAGAAGIVIARAMVRDMYSGLEAGRLYAALSSVLPLAPVLAPLLGGQLLLVTTWRGIFAVQAAIGIALLIAALAMTHETLAPSSRHTGSLHAALLTYRSLLHRRNYMTMALGGSLAFATLFAYISASSFVYQNVLGVSPQVFGLLFGLNGAGLLAMNIVNARLIRTIPMARLLRAGVRILAVGGLLILVATVLHLGAWALLPLLFVSVSSVGLVISNSIALSMEGEGERAGSAAALFGMLQFAAGAAVAPIVGIAGASAIPMGVVMAAAGVAGLAVNASQPRR